MKFVRGRAVIHKLFVSAICRFSIDKRIYGRSHLPDNFWIMFRRDRMTPYTSLASSSKASPVLVKCCVMGEVGV